LIYYGLEYKFITLYLTRKISYQEMIRDLEIAIHQVREKADDMVQRNGKRKELKYTGSMVRFQ